MSNIRDIVEEVRETPSPRCWDSIASQLPAAGAAAGASAATMGKTAAVATKSALSAGKIAAIIGSAAAVTAGVITTVVVTTTEPATTTPATNDNSMAILTDTAAIDADTLILEEPIATTENVNIAQNIQKPSENTIPSHHNITPKTTNNNLTATTITNPIVPTPASVNNSMPTAQNIAPTTHPVSSPSNTTHSSPQATPKTQTPPQTTDNDKNDDDLADLGFAKPIKIEIPNIFTPNGDGVNDLFVINGIENCEKSTLIVKDHTGRTVLQSQHYENNWDGNNLPDGTYFYQFAYTINNINEVRRGQLMIRR